MTLLRFLTRSCRGLMVWTIITSVVSGACNAGLVALVSSVLTRTGPATQALVWGFVALGLGKVLSNVVSQIVLARFSQGAIARLRRDLISQILGVPLRQLEELGSARILVALTDDIFNITQALLAIPLVSVNVAILLGGAAYLGWLSWQILAAVALLIVFGGVGYRLMVARAFHWLNFARAEEDRLFGYFRALTEGIKELKLHRSRRGAFYQNIHDTTEIYQQHNVAAETCFITAQNWNHFLYFALIGIILFVVPRFAVFSPKTLTGYVVTSLYLMGPLAGVMTSISLFGRASVALQKVQDLGVSLAAHSTEGCSFEQAEAEAGFSRLEFKGIVHSYHREAEDSHFVLGPMDLAFHPGELVFLVGGNGSGKSTLAKIVAGLYAPEAGEVRLDDCLITDKNRDKYRQLFSAVFADFYLFENLLGLNNANLDAQAQEYLSLLHLQHKVKIRNGTLSTTAVSQGQRKRLALLTAYLEDRPFYLFDEWAADQDPYFKNIFYTQLLPELKARGKTVLVISHDDKYFDVADRILKLDYGKLVTTSTPIPEAGVLA
ncbi:MAG TPA: cyclic peptide export ABC transporter [Patescibacteria group bacterium]|nr:cyclic peptide export ABC transporter [Patescibacteria group bacterium]